MRNTKKTFLERKNVIISFRRYGIDAMSAMALGLFASLLIGTIINTIGQNVAPGSMISQRLLEIGGYATSVTGPVMALAIGHALMAPPLLRVFTGGSRSSLQCSGRLRRTPGCVFYWNYCL